MSAVQYLFGKHQSAISLPYKEWCVNNYVGVVCCIKINHRLHCLPLPDTFHHQAQFTSPTITPQRTLQWPASVQARK